MFCGCCLIITKAAGKSIMRCKRQVRRKTNWPIASYGRYLPARRIALRAMGRFFTLLPDTSRMGRVFGVIWGYGRNAIRWGLGT